MDGSIDSQCIMGNLYPWVEESVEITIGIFCEYTYIFEYGTQIGSNEQNSWTNRLYIHADSPLDLVAELLQVFKSKTQFKYTPLARCG